MLKEMEQSSLLSQGLSSMTNECLFRTSDWYQVNVCEKCGHIISLPTECRMCRGKSTVATVNLPYATKLLFQELESMSVKIQINVK